MRLPISGEKNVARLRSYYGDAVQLRTLSKQTLLSALEARFREHFLDEAIHGLERRHPDLSARRLLTPGLIAAAVITSVVTVLAIWLRPAIAEIALASALGLAFVANSLFRAVLVWIGAEPQNGPVPAACDDGHLPLYSIIVPLHREANVVPWLIRALGALDYPHDKLEIALVVEADDCDTIAAIAAEAPDSRFLVIEVPPSLPRTKPKAANYALGFLSGDFTVIYDAEDRPETDQLLKAVAAFRAAPERIACLQARLNFYNAAENWLTRMFALDYALWFDFLLPGLERLCVPMPLGGTSNHFRTHALRAIAGWDPYNVTEDADLGIRLARLGLGVATLNSTTYEEATVELGNWLRQRSRWMKGYMQTWIVHMRNPSRLVRHAGVGGFVGFQLFVGGTFLTALLNPLLWAVYLCSMAFGGIPHTAFLDAPFGDFSAMSLFAGNALFAYLSMLGPYRRGWLELTPYGFTAPFYWILISAAGYRGMWQLATRPWHWDKTQHGRTRHAPSFVPTEIAP